VDDCRMVTPHKIPNLGIRHLKLIPQGISDFSPSSH
jgi:hypothetical protein